MAELRAYCHIDRMQPQFASLFVEVLPGVEINRLADISLKVTNAKPGEMIVERRYGMMEIHSFEREEILHAGQMILEELGLKEEDRLAPAASIAPTNPFVSIIPSACCIVHSPSSIF